MSSWPDKYVIGLTGNIATGKSVVRKMLEHLGVYGIDADALAHRAIMKGAPGYQATIDAFGRWILGDDDQIDRSKLGKIVFTADVAIENSGTFEETWNQVSKAWKSIPKVAVDAPPTEKSAAPPSPKQLTVKRATPNQAGQIAVFITEQSSGKRRMTRTDVMEAFGEKAFLLLLAGSDLVGILGWQVENLITRVDDVILKENVLSAQNIKLLVETIEKASSELQSEAALLFLPPVIAKLEKVWSSLGYQSLAVEDLSVRAWQNAAEESILPGMTLFFKRLREHRILRPMV